MKLKGGIAYIDMKGSIVENNISAADAVYVEGLYNPCLKAVKSGKIAILYNCGGVVENIPILVQGYNITDSGAVIMRITIISRGTSYYAKWIVVKDNDTYYVTPA